MKRNDGCSDRILPFLFSVPYVHRDETNIIQRRMVQVGGGGDHVGADATIHGGGSGSGRYEETVRAYRGLLTVKTLQGPMLRLRSPSIRSLIVTVTTGPSFGSWIWGTGRSVQIVESTRGYHDIWG